jgi:hypothetical protein
MLPGWMQKPGKISPAMAGDAHPGRQVPSGKKLNLDDRPVILLATNVLGDSLTLGRQVFSKSMAEWVEETVRYFADRQDVQLVIRCTRES